MIENEMHIFSRNLPSLDNDAMPAIRKAVTTGLRLGVLGEDSFETDLFTEIVARTSYYASAFLNIPATEFSIGSGILGEKRYLACSDIIEDNIGEVTFNLDYVRAHVVDRSKSWTDRNLVSYILQPSVAEITAHENYHIWQLLVMPKRVRREAMTCATNDSWDKSLSERAALRFGKMFVNTLAMHNHASEAQLFGGYEGYIPE